MRLSERQIREIIKATHEGEPRSSIAARFSIDASTVTYHVERFEDRYGSTSAVYSLIPSKPRVCSHPSMKCLVCGLAQDETRRREMETIRSLTQRLERANGILVQSGYEPE